MLSLELVAVAGTCLLFFACRGAGHALIARLGPRIGLTERARRRVGTLIETRGRSMLLDRARDTRAAHDHGGRGRNLGHLCPSGASAAPHRGEHLRAAPPAARSAARPLRSRALRRGEGHRHARARRGAGRRSGVLARPARTASGRPELVRSCRARSASGSQPPSTGRPASIWTQLPQCITRLGRNPEAEVRERVAEIAHKAVGVEGRTVGRHEILEARAVERFASIGDAFVEAIDRRACRWA